jgi:multisubunit Na+/H+ antiporter MnhE subunit
MRVTLRAAGEWVGQSLVAMGAWMVFTARPSATELAAGAVASAVAGAVSRLVWAHNGAMLTGAGRSLLQAWRLPAAALTGTWEILSVLVRHLAGAPAPSLLLSVPFDVGDDGPRAEARRALAVTYTTITPNFIVLGIDRRRGLLWYHQIRRGPVLRLTVELGARP